MVVDGLKVMEYGRCYTYIVASHAGLTYAR